MWLRWTNILYGPLNYPKHATCHAHLIRHYFITLAIISEEHTLGAQYVLVSSLMLLGVSEVRTGRTILFSSVFSNTAHRYFLLRRNTTLHTQTKQMKL
jgi:hypothetical protein